MLLSNIMTVLVKRFKVLSVKSHSVDLCSASPLDLPNALGVLYRAKRNV